MKNSPLPHLCCVCKHFWYIHVLSGTSQPGPDSAREKNWKFRIGKCFTNVNVFVTWAEKNSPSRWYVGWKKLIFINWSSTLLYELLYFHFVNVCNAKSWNCLTKMIKKKSKRISRLWKIDLAIIGQTLLRINQLVKMAKIERSKNFPPWR